MAFPIYGWPALRRVGGRLYGKIKEDEMGYEGSDRGYRGSGYRQDSQHRDRGFRGGQEREQGRYGQSYGGGYRSPRDRYDAPPRDYDYDERGFFDRAGDEVRSWFGDEEAERRRRYDERYAMREEERGYGRDRDQGRRAPPMSGIYGAAAGYGAASAYGAGSGGAGRHDHDPNYRAWRDRQLDTLDRDYDEYRREHQSRFDQHFGEWRQGREQQRRSLRDVQKHQEVVGSDGQHVGTVDAVKGDRIVLTKTDSEAGGRHHEIPCAWIARVADKVELNRTHDQAQAAWRDVEHDDRGGLFGGRDQDRIDDGSGPHVLNRSFSGTY